jgi:hypothetical protein
VRALFKEAAAGDDADARIDAANLLQGIEAGRAAGHGQVQHNDVGTAAFDDHCPKFFKRFLAT